MTREEADLIIAEQNKSKDEILKAVAKVKSDCQELCNLKDRRIAELEEENRQLKNEVEDLTAYCNQIGKIKTGVLKLFENVVAK